ncbi:peptidyl-dipeptidase Dcp [Leifsonia sp. 98AMF]|uniref:M3 family metallopeptidase n=1 Tax=unclassified Leifsonia TaxID=2663824 RepID=UPI00087A9D8B|nr:MULTISPECIES: M3 family metallopeptidase [unclassified Leifsonia]SDH30494.1 peptidyl-dipeptidase Dcp [Leifsonia sp. 197AMF]SDJ05041.1 peptidyl-dipeptidase Dcp [Leifsonia sp. 466MF]SDJ67292.1 peptidyl-dipeptidase Dcp [Leifsonia sp. 157MF]SDN25440.1 peptidyl-dipeptidase Dcp [Leifsonia sp. 509MF]SEM95056.1 peptidyl-dipeptidase Dcp [Leifsonia sp. 467MF]
MAETANPFFTASTLPYQLPPFAEIRDEHYRPAFEHGFEEQLAEIDAIVASDEAATFENTMLPLERSGQTLLRVAEVFFNKSSSDSTDFTNALEEEMAPRLAAHQDAIRLNPALYARIASLHAQLDELGLDPESQYLVERYYTEFTLAGAGLDDADKERLREYNQRLSTLTTRFEKNLLADTNDLAVVFDSAEELDGLGEGELSAAAQAAAERGLDGKFVVSLVLPTGHPWLADLTRRESRERIMAASRARGIRGGDNDNRDLVLEITRLRAERARLLGFDTHAAYVTADQTARTPEAVADMLGRLAPPAARNARTEQADLQRQLGDDETVEAWDWAYLTGKVRAEKFDVDFAAMRPYFEAERVLRDGVFYAANRLYGISFTERPDLVAYHPDARVFEARNEDGSELGLYILDLYTRDSKRGGAWMNPLISQSALLDTPTVVVNNLNVPKPAAGEPTLLTYDETNTLFHEFGHALHGLFARVTYPRFAGTNVFRDFVEFPSQVNEMWMLWPEVLENYAVHFQTGERMPQELVDKLHAAEGFNEGFATSEYLGAALLDQAWHRITADDTVDDVAAFEARALADVGLDNPAVPPRYASTYFAHTFSGGYDAGYYSYIWSEVLDADTVEWFRENGGLTRENGDRFRARLLGVGGSKDPLEAYRDFRGRDAEIEPLLKRRGLDN